MMTEAIEQLTGGRLLSALADFFGGLAGAFENVSPNDNVEGSGVIPPCDSNKDDSIQSIGSVRPEMAGD